MKMATLQGRWPASSCKPLAHNMSLLWLLAQILLFLLTLAVAGALVIGLDRTAIRAGTSSAVRRQMRAYVSLGLALWLTILTELARMGALLEADGFPMLALVFMPVLLAGLWLMRSSTFRLLLRFVMPQWLIWIHSFRALLALLYYLLWVAGLLPLHLSLQGLNQDFIVGLTAPLAATLFFGRRYYPLQAMLWHLFGMLLAGTTLLLIVWSTPSTRAAFPETTTLFTEFPFVWVVGFLMPLAIVLHAFALWQLRLFRK